MRTSGNKFGDCVGECAKGVHVKYWERVLSIIYSTFREDDGNEMDTGRLE